MASSYKLSKAEFGLRSYSVALPDSPEGTPKTTPSHPVAKSRSFDLQPNEARPGTSLKQKLKGWLKGGSSKYKAEKSEAQVDDQTPVKQSPLHKRSWLSGKTNAPVEVEEEQVQSSPSLVKMSMKRKDSQVYQVTLRSNKQGLGMLYSAGLPPITVIFVERGGQAEGAGVRTGDVLLSVNGVDCFNPNLSISQLMEIKAVINQTNKGPATHMPEPQKKEEFAILRSKSVSNPMKTEVEEKLSQASSELEVSYIDSEPEGATKNSESPRPPNKEKMHSGLLNAYTKDREPLILKVQLETEDESSDMANYLMNVPKQKPSLHIENSNTITESHYSPSKDVDFQSVTMQTASRGANTSSHIPSSVDFQDTLKLVEYINITDNTSIQSSTVAEKCDPKSTLHMELVAHIKDDNPTSDPSVDMETISHRIPKQKPHIYLGEDDIMAQSFPSTNGINLLDVPKLQPSLGLQIGHSRRDIVARRQKKHRPATNRHTLLLDSDEAVWMGTTRVEVPTSTAAGGSKSVNVLRTQSQQSDMQSEGYPSAEGMHQVRKQPISPQHQPSITTPQHQPSITTPTDNLKKRLSLGEFPGKLSVNDSKLSPSRNKSAEMQSKAKEKLLPSQGESISMTSSKEDSSSVLPNLQMSKRTSTVTNSAQGMLPVELRQKISARAQMKRQSLDVEVYLNTVTEDSRTASSLQPQGGPPAVSGPAVSGPAIKQSIASPESITESKEKHFSSPGGSTNTSGPPGSSKTSGPVGSTNTSGPVGSTNTSGPPGSSKTSGPVGSTNTSGPLGSSDTSVPGGKSSNQMKRGRSYTFGSRTELKGLVDSKATSTVPNTKNPEKLEDLATAAPNLTTATPYLTTAALNLTTAAPNLTTAAPNLTTAAPNLTTAAPNLQSTADSLLPRKGLVKARMSMFQKQ